jgi:hypothetical protein
MKTTIPCPALVCLAASLMLAACASDPPTQTATSQRDTPVTGSHIGKKYTTGPDNSGVTVYGGGGDPGATGGNGLPVPRPYMNSK